MAGFSIQEDEIIVTTLVLRLDEEEAGYLYDLLKAHVAGPLVHGGALGRIGKALEAAVDTSAGIERRYAYNRNMNDGPKIAILEPGGYKSNQE